MENEVQNEISSWIRVPAGVLLTGVLLLCIAGSITFFIDSPKGKILGAVLGSLFLLLSLWGLDKSIRMMFGWRRRRGLVSSTTLNVVAFLFLLVPIAGLFTDNYSKNGFVAILQVAWNIGMFFGIRALAKSREEMMLNQEDAPDQKTVR